MRGRDRTTGKLVTLDKDRAFELLVGGTIGLWSLAAQMKLSDEVGMALLMVLKEAISKATPGALVAIYETLETDQSLPPGTADLLPVTAARRSLKRRRKT